VIFLIIKVNFFTYPKNRIPSSIYFDSPNINEIANCVSYLNVNKAVEHDNVFAYFISTTFLVLPFPSPFLNILLDYSFKNSIFRNDCKIAKVFPICKKGDVNNPNNYRPISILPCLSKIFEKFLYKRLTNYIDKKKT